MTADYARTEWDRAIDALRDARLLYSGVGFVGVAVTTAIAIAAFSRGDRRRPAGAPVRARIEVTDHTSLSTAAMKRSKSPRSRLSVR